MKNKYNIFLCLSLSLIFSGCSEEILDTEKTQNTDNYINVGGVELNMLNTTVDIATRAGEGEVVDAETLGWLVPQLKAGLDITYGYAEGTVSHERVAKLKLLKDAEDTTSGDYTVVQPSGYAKYSFEYVSEPTISGDPAVNTPAKWYGNNLHYFQGVNVPTKLNTEIPQNLVTDQHDDSAISKSDNHDGNYTLLERYLAMPATTRLSATISRVKLPFRHRLARVIAYVLIDPDMAKDANGQTIVTLDGFKKDAAGNAVTVEDPTTTALRFCNVEVLEKVITVNGKYQPVWKSARKVIPHFMGERGSYKTSSLPAVENNTDVSGHLYVYTKTADKTKYYPSNGQDWLDAHNAYTANPTNSGYTRVDYGLVPCYDIIVRPTYTELDNIMYDESVDLIDTQAKKEALVKKKNKIDFELTLSNGLIYQKSFEFDLDANYETIVYLSIEREGVDYNTSGAELWDGETKSDEYYGVNNLNGNTLSIAGSSWQRAYRATTVNHAVTDGHFYQKDDDNDAQYLGSDAKWIEFFLEAKKGGKHHGDYFILDHDIDLTGKVPSDFVFTGHLDARDHKIKINGSYLFAGLNGDYDTAQEGTGAENWEANVHKEKAKDGNEYWVPFKGWRAEVLNAKVVGGKLFKDDATITGNVQNCFEGVDGTTRVNNHTPALPQYK